MAPQGLREIWSVTSQVVRVSPISTLKSELKSDYQISPLKPHNQGAQAPEGIGVTDAAVRLTLAQQGLGQATCIHECALAIKNAIKNAD